MNPILTGLADEAGTPIDVQLRAIRELGWNHLELRGVAVNGGAAANVHDLPEPEFEQVAASVANSGVVVHAFGSTIANWAAQIDAPFEPALAAVDRAIPRMQALGTRFIRIMSFAICPGDDQMDAERFRRLREMVARFHGAGIQPLHENCNNYGGLSAAHTLRLLEEVPGLRLIFDTGNTVGAEDRSRPAPHPRQSAWEFYLAVRDAVDYIHVKDGVLKTIDGKLHREHTWPGEGEGEIRRILTDALERGQVHTISIEPHISGDPDQTGLSGESLKYHNFVAYGRRLAQLLKSIDSDRFSNPAASSAERLSPAAASPVHP